MYADKERLNNTLACLGGLFLQVSLNVALESCFLPTADGGHRVSWGHVVVLDNFIPNEVREKLLGLITMPGESLESTNSCPH